MQKPSVSVRPVQLSVAWLACCALAAACGTDGAISSKSTPSIKRTVQRALTEVEWKAVIGDSAPLASLEGKVGKAFQAAGVIEGGDGRRLQWAEYADDSEAPRTSVVALFRSCDADASCTVGRGTHTATGVLLTDDAGEPVSHVTPGEVVLHKTLKHHNLDASETVLRLDLTRKHIVDRDLAALYTASVKQGFRRLVVLSAYGPEVGVPLKDLRAAAEQSGIFDEVQMIAFARRRDLQTLLPTMTPQDVLVWVGAGVIEPFSDAASKSVGMTLSRGVFGDELIHRNHVAKLLEAPVLGGPGLILLVGSNSLTIDHAEQTGLMAEHLHQATYRPVVGFDGKLTLKTAEAGAVALLNALFGGETLSTAMAAANEASGATTTTMLTGDQAKLWKLPVAKAAFWSAAPKGATLRLYLKNSPKCVTLPAAGVCTEQGFKTGAAVPPEKLTAASAVFTCDVTFDGPWLSCTSKNTVTGADFALRGVMTGKQAGDYILVTVTGAPSLKMVGITAVGAGLIETVTEKKGTLSITFGGEAAGSTWMDGAGHCCIAVTPLLTGNQSERSVLTIKR